MPVVLTDLPVNFQHVVPRLIRIFLKTNKKVKATYFLQEGVFSKVSVVVVSLLGSQTLWTDSLGSDNSETF